MDFNRLIARVRAVLLTPTAEWPAIAAEPATAASLYSGYVFWLAGAAALAGFISNSLIGTHTGLFGVWRVGITLGLVHAVVQFALYVAYTWLFAWLLDALAPTFGGTKDRLQATRAAAYAFTAGWVGSIAAILPFLGWLLALAGAIYGIYLLYLGLPHTMKCPADKAGAYTAVSILIAIVAGWILSAVVFSLLAFGGLSASPFGHGGLVRSGGFEADSPGGQLEQWARGVEEAGKRSEAAQKSGDPAAAAQAAGGVLAAALGGKSNVEALAPDRIKAFLPETLAGLPRTEVSAERNGAIGLQVSEAEARYGAPGGPGIHVKVSDLGGASGLAALASWTNIEQERQTQNGYEKTYKSGGRLVHEEWNNGSGSGEYTVVVGQRFAVEASGGAASIDVLRDAANAVDLAGLEALRNDGVK